MEECSKIERQYHYFFEAIQPVLETLPELIRGEIATLELYFQNYQKLENYVDEPREKRRERRQSWYLETYQTIKKCFDYLNFLDRELTTHYFDGKIPSQVKSAPKTYKMLLELIQVTRQPNFRDLDHFLNELNHLHLQGNELFGPVVSATAKRKESNRLKKLYQQKYKTVQYYLKAYYNELDTDYHTFFLN